MVMDMAILKGIMVEGPLQKNVVQEFAKQLK